MQLKLYINNQSHSVFGLGQFGIMIYEKYLIGKIREKNDQF